MEYTTIEADIHRGQITVREPERLPAEGHGLLIVLPDAVLRTAPDKPQARLSLPIIQGDGSHIISPTPEELDASLWD